MSFAGYVPLAENLRAHETGIQPTLSMVQLDQGSQYVHSLDEFEKSFVDYSVNPNQRGLPPDLRRRRWDPPLQVVTPF